MAHNTQARAIARQSRFPRSLLDQSPSSEHLSSSAIFNTTLNTSHFQHQRRISSMLHSNGDDNVFRREINSNTIGHNSNSIGPNSNTIGHNSNTIGHNSSTIGQTESQKSWLSCETLKPVSSNQYRKLFDQHQSLLGEFNKLKAELEGIRSNPESALDPSTTQSTPESPSSSLIFISSCNDPECGLSDKVRTLGKTADSYKNQNIQLQEKLKALNRKLSENQKNENRKSENQKRKNEESEKATSQQTSLTSPCKVVQGGSKNNSFVVPRTPSSSNKNHQQSTDRELLSKISQLEAKIEQVEEENREVKENLEFVTIETNVLQESLKEVEDQLAKEREERADEKKSFEDIVTSTKKLYEKVNSKKETIKSLEAQLASKEELVEKLMRENEEITSTNQLLIEAWHSLDTMLPLESMNDSPVKLKMRPKDVKEVVAIITKRSQELKSFFDEVESIKKEVINLIEENISLKNSAKEKSMEGMKKSENMQMNELMKRLDEERERIAILEEEIEQMKGKVRSSEAEKVELKKQVTEMTSKEFGSCIVNNPLVLRQELKTCREMLNAKEEKLQMLAGKYTRNRQVWEENERKANDEIKKLDQVLDRVILTLSANDHVLEKCPQLKDLLCDLTQDQTTQSTFNMSSTFV